MFSPCFRKYFDLRNRHVFSVSILNVVIFSVDKVLSTGGNNRDSRRTKSSASERQVVKLRRPFPVLSADRAPEMTYVRESLETGGRRL